MRARAQKPLIGIAPRNPLYHPVKPGSSDKLKIPMIKRRRGKVEVLEPVSDAGNRYGLLSWFVHAAPRSRLPLDGAEVGVHLRDCLACGVSVCRVQKS